MAVPDGSGRLGPAVSLAGTGLCHEGTAVLFSEIASFLLSPLGLLGLLLSTALSITLLYVEQAGIMVIAWEGIAGRRGTGWAALQISVRRRGVSRIHEYTIR